MSMEWVRRHYGIPAKRGGRVIFDSSPGRITAARGGRASGLSSTTASGQSRTRAGAWSTSGRTANPSGRPRSNDGRPLLLRRPDHHHPAGTTNPKENTMSEATTTTPDLATAIDDLTERLRVLVEASVHLLRVMPADSGDDLAQAFADEMVGRAKYDDEDIAVWEAFLTAIRAERG